MPDCQHVGSVKKSGVFGGAPGVGVGDEIVVEDAEPERDGGFEAVVAPAHAAFAHAVGAISARLPLRAPSLPASG